MRSVARSVGRSFVRLLARSVDRLFARSVGWSVVRSVGRLIRSLGVPSVRQSVNLSFGGVVLSVVLSVVSFGGVGRSVVRRGVRAVGRRSLGSSFGGVGGSVLRWGGGSWVVRSVRHSVRR